MKKRIKKHTRSRSSFTKYLLGFVLFFVILIGGYFLTHSFNSPTSRLVEGASSPDEIIVKFKSTVSQVTADTIHKNNKTILKRRIPKIGTDVVKLSTTTLTKTLTDYQNDPSVVYAEPNFKAEATELTNDPSLSQEYGLYTIKAASTASASAWDITHGSTTTRVAILDTGIDATHPDLQGKIVSTQNFSPSTTTTDIYGHGTHVAGITAASTNNATGVAGVGYNTALMNVKVLGDDGMGYYDGIAAGIIWATDNGAKVINMSLGGPTYSQTLEDAVNYAWNHGVVIVAAAGNSNSTTAFYPAFFTNVIAVGATDAQDAKASFSNYGSSWVDLAAPGVNVYSTYKNATYVSLSGTSMATPFVSGTAALVWARSICQSNACVRNQLESTADHISGTGSNWAWGRINAYNAVKSLSNSPIPTATPTTALTPTAIPTPTPTKQPTPTPTKAPTPTPTKIPTPTSTQTAITITRLTPSYRKTGINRWITENITVNKIGTTEVVSGARITLLITAPSGFSYVASGYTRSDGTYSGRFKSKEIGEFTIKVTSVNKTGYKYIPTITTTTIMVE